MCFVGNAILCDDLDKVESRPPRGARLEEVDHGGAKPNPHDPRERFWSNGDVVYRAIAAGLTRPPEFVPVVVVRVVGANYASPFSRRQSQLHRPGSSDIALAVEHRVGFRNFVGARGVGSPSPRLAGGCVSPVNHGSACLIRLCARPAR
jgi:hypothetical protein